MSRSCHNYLGCGVLEATLGEHADLSAMPSPGAILSASTGQHARLTASVVCELGDMPYLEIDPTYLWIIPDDLVTNDVYSNTSWNIT